MRTFGAHTGLDRAAEAEKVKQQRIRNILLKIKNRAAAQAFDGWGDAVSTLVRNRIAVQRCLAKMKLRAAAAALDSWVDLVDRRSAARRFCKKMYYHWRSERLGKSFVQWHCQLGEQAQAMHAARLEARAKRAQQQRLKFMLNKIRMRSAPLLFLTVALSKIVGDLLAKVEILFCEIRPEN